MPETPETPEGPQQGPPSIEEDPKRRPTRAESTPGGVAAPLGSETYEVQPLPALDALLQTNFMETLPSVKGLKDLQPHAQSHEPFGDDRVLAFGPLYLHDPQYDEYIEAGMADADGNTVLFTLGVVNAELGFGLSLARNVTDRAGAFLDQFNANVWDPMFMGIAKSHTGTPGVEPDMDSSFVSQLYLKGHDITEVRRLEFYDSDQAAGNEISLQQRGDAAGAILEIVNSNDATQYSSPTYRRLRLADPVGADDAATKRYVDALSYAGHALLDGSLHTDTLAAGVTDGSIVIGNVTPKWSELVISIPAANVRNVLGIDNGELRPSWKAALDATNPVNAGGAASPGTSLIFSHRDHVHAVAASHSGSAHHALVSLAADAQELLNLSTQELGFVAKAANLIFAGPAAGGAADPTFRSMVAADLVAHTTSHKHGGGDEVATATAAANAIPKAGAGGKLAAGWIQEVLAYADLTDDPYADHDARHEPGGADPMAVDAVVATGSLRTLGAGAQQACPGDDGRLSDDRDPTAHAGEHVDGTDDIQDATAGQKGVATAAQITKLDAIEALANVTDAANVAAAGAVMDSDISPGEGFLRKTGAGAYTAHKSNLAAAAAPDADDDADAGYSVGSVWIDTTNDDMHICVDSTNDAAVWLHLNAAAAAHTIASHSDTTATGTELETLTDGSDADGLHDHATLITAAEAIAAVEGEATLALGGAVAVTGILTVDVVNEKTADDGVTIDGLPIKDGTIDYSRALTDAFWCYSEFIRAASSNADPAFAQGVTGAGATWTDDPAAASHPGVWVGGTGTTNTGHVRLYTQVDGLIFSNGRIRMGAWVRTATLSVAAQRYEIYAGIMDGALPAISLNGMLMSYKDDVNGGKWQATVVNAGGFTNQDTGILAVLSTWYYLEMEMNAAGNSVEFFIDGVSVTTIASGPAANATAEARIGIRKYVGGGTRSVAVDAAYILGEFTVAR